MASVIHLQNVSKNYGKAIGVTNVSLDVGRGSVFGFLGPNGAGKSTTINMLLDFIRPTGGSVKLFGLDAQQDSVEIHHRVGFLAGDMAMDRGLSGWQQLEYLGNLRGSFDKDYVTELAKRLDCKLNRKFKHLSRGNKQKVGLIAALMHKPELLILDEPTSGLDPLIQAAFNKIILDRKNEGMTTFVSSHVLSEVQEICDIVTFIRNGKIIDTKTIEQLAKEAPKQFRIAAGDRKALQAELAKLKGVHVEAVDHSLKGTFSGDVNQMLKVLARYDITDLSLENTDLEATFMKYYEGEEEVPDSA